MTPSLSIIIVNFNANLDLINCLNSIFSAQYPEYSELIIVDNNSSDDSLDAIGVGFPNVKIIKNTCNMGFAKACNQGLRYSKGNYVLFLNPDTIILNDALVKSLFFMDSNPNIGVIGCRLLNKDGSLQPSCADFPYLRKILLDHILRKRIFNDTLKRKFLLRYWAHDEIREVDWVLGAFLMARRAVMNSVGGFDEEFFLYGEDLDLCFRIKKAGWKVVFYPPSEVIHIGNPLWDTERLERVYNALLKFYRKHFSSRNLHFLRFLMKLIFLLRKEKVVFSEN